MTDPQRVCDNCFIILENEKTHQTPVLVAAALTPITSPQRAGVNIMAAAETVHESVLSDHLKKVEAHKLKREAAEKRLNEARARHNNALKVAAEAGKSRGAIRKNVPSSLFSH
jgi:hypothetical protein